MVDHLRVIIPPDGISKFKKYRKIIRLFGGFYGQNHSFSQ